MERIQETFKGFLGGEDAKQLRDKARAQAKCQELVAAREKCWRDSAAQTKETDECYQEELLEKRCLAQCLCSKAAAAFYQKTDCHLYSEHFAFQDDQAYQAGREKILADPVRLNFCRQVTMNLAKCMAKYNRSCK